MKTPVVTMYWTCSAFWLGVNGGRSRSFCEMARHSSETNQSNGASDEKWEELSSFCSFLVEHVERTEKKEMHSFFIEAPCLSIGQAPGNVWPKMFEKKQRNTSLSF